MKKHQLYNEITGLHSVAAVSAFTPSLYVDFSDNAKAGTATVKCKLGGRSRSFLFKIKIRRVDGIKTSRKVHYRCVFYVN